MTASRTTSERVRVGIVGGGAITQVAHLPVLKKLKSIEVRAICDTDLPKARALAADPPIAARTLASPKTMFGPLPPSSAVNGTMLSAAARPMWRAVSGEPGSSSYRAIGSPV